MKLRLFAFDDERIDPFHDGLLRIHRHAATSIVVQVPGKSEHIREAEADVVVECTYAAPGWVEMPERGQEPARHGRHEVLARVLDYAKECLADGGYDIILLDNTLRSPSGEQRDYGVDELLPVARAGSPDALIAIITGYRMIAEERGEALQRAFSGEARADMWLPKTSESLCDSLCSIILLVAREKQLWLENVELRSENQQLRVRSAELKQELRYPLDYHKCREIVSHSAAFVSVFEQVKSAAKTDFSVLITGESGTGKELIARAIHKESHRANGPLMEINAGAFTETLLESELFGHEKGAFTGAIAERRGLFEVVDGGTLFLDEVAELTPATQVRLLRVLESGEFTRVGGNKVEQANVRIIAATNRNLESLIAAGEFREELYYRLCVIPIALPPLRERPEDVKLLASRFLKEFSTQMAKSVTGISEQAERTLIAYPWPGNVRELHNVMARAVLFCKSEQIDVGDLPMKVLEGGSQGEGQHSGTGAAQNVSATPWMETLDASVFQELCDSICTSGGGGIGNDADTIVARHGLVYLRAVLAAFWVALRDSGGRDLFNKIFGFPRGKRKSMTFRHYVEDRSQSHQEIFPPSPGQKSYGLRDLYADGEALRQSGFSVRVDLL